MSSLISYSERHLERISLLRQRASAFALELQYLDWLLSYLHHLSLNYRTVCLQICVMRLLLCILQTTHLELIGRQLLSTSRMDRLCYDIFVSLLPLRFTRFTGLVRWNFDKCITFKYFLDCVTEFFASQWYIRNGFPLQAYSILRTKKCYCDFETPDVVWVDPYQLSLCMSCDWSVNKCSLSCETSR